MTTDTRARAELSPEELSREEPASTPPPATPAPDPDDAGGDARASDEIGSLDRTKRTALVVAVFFAGLCGLVYELLIGTASSYFLGDSVRQFSITIGLFMASMGFGAFLSRRLRGDVLSSFVFVEIVLGLAGGLSIPVLYAVYAYTEIYKAVMFALIFVVGTLTGLEIPMLVLAMRRHFSLRANLSNILSLDYLGALGATLLFPFLLLPVLGTFKSSLLVGAVNVVTALIVVGAFRGRIDPVRRSMGVVGGVCALVGLGFMLAFSGELLQPWHSAVYDDRVILARQSKYQMITLTRYRDDVRLFLNGNLQFSSTDEHRYHEALVHPAMSLAARHDQVLILGGGDGLAARELLKYPDVKGITLVDLDPAITELGRTHRLLKDLNHGSLDSNRVKVVNDDAWVFVEHADRAWDVVLIDLPDPNNVSIARLYSQEFYGLVKRHLAGDGVLVTQATSPYYSKDAFWCIDATMRAVGFHTKPYHMNVPSFGDWGFILASSHALDPARIALDVPTKYLSVEIVSGMFRFPKDVMVAKPLTSTLDSPLVLGAYLDDWNRWK